MYINVELLIYSYMALCLCILLYNIIFIGYSKTEKKRSFRRFNKWKNIIELQFNKDNITTDKTHELLLQKKLLRINQLYAYDEALQELLKSNHDKTKEYIANNLNTSVYLAKKYLDKDSIKKGYLAYMLSKYLVFDSSINQRIGEIIIDYTLDKSIYCRENALRAIYSIGNVEDVLSAYRLMNKNSIFHNIKLVADGLLLFNGDRIKLCNALWDSFYEFNISYQLAFINFIKNVSGDFCDKFFAVLQSDNISQEVKFAIIRYYRKYSYEPARNYLYNCIKFQSELDFTFSALAASALENYPSDETIRVLKSALTSNNWYTRNNASNSLQKLGVDYIDLLDVYSGNDRYAREMMEYKMVLHNS